jgi:UDP-3-O-[3-hydroxymyristoyl] glucosamine N-acyltransferase
VKLAPLSVTEVAKLTEGTITGDTHALITGVAPITQAGVGDLSFIAQPRYLEHLTHTAASAVFIDRSSTPPTVARHLTLIRVVNPYFAFVRILRHYLPAQSVATGVADTAQIGTNVHLGEAVAIGPYAVIADDCEIEDGVQIGAQCYVGRGSRLGANTILCAGVRVAHEVRIGKNVIIQFGSVIGSDGFGYVPYEGRQHKIPHLGTVVLEDEVEIGANCCIDRGTFGDTRVKRGAKLDNLVHVAHNVTIGENTLIAAQTGISGSTVIGSEVTIAGQVGFVGHIEIGDRAMIGAQAGVTKSIPAGLVVSGYPARDHRKAKREEASLRRLPQLLQRVRVIEKMLRIDRSEDGTESQ